MLYTAALAPAPWLLDRVRVVELERELVAGGRSGLQPRRVLGMFRDHFPPQLGPGVSLPLPCRATAITPERGLAIGKMQAAALLGGSLVGGGAGLGVVAQQVHLQIDAILGEYCLVIADGVGREHLRMGEDVANLLSIQR